jgi:protein-S-isoprenylcysteine O-methyltransferase Ste14
MSLPFKVILLHQILFQGMFLAKNIYLRHKLGVAVRGGNREANLAIIFFAVFIALSLVFALSENAPGRVALLSPAAALATATVVLVLNLLVAAASLLGLRDSWRVGIIEDQQTALVEDGIYRYSRNPYFLSYLLLFAAYTVLLQNLVLALLGAVGFVLIHAMVRREEHYLAAVHGDTYREYCGRVPRYLIW